MYAIINFSLPHRWHRKGWGKGKKTQQNPNKKQIKKYCRCSLKSELDWIQHIIIITIISYYYYYILCIPQSLQGRYSCVSLQLFLPIQQSHPRALKVTLEIKNPLGRESQERYFYSTTSFLMHIIIFLPVILTQRIAAARSSCCIPTPRRPGFKELKASKGKNENLQC